MSTTPALPPRLKKDGYVDDGALQLMWKVIGFDKLLEKLAESIKDWGGNKQSCLTSFERETWFPSSL